MTHDPTAADAPPVVLIIGGNDPSGGAGLIADVQSVTAMGAHPAAVPTAITVQDTSDAYQVEPVDAALVHRQLEVLIADLPIAAVKLGLLATAAIGHAVADILGALTGVPVVIDPVLVASGGATLAEDQLTTVYRERLFAMANVVTPNAHEAQVLGGATAILATGAGAVLLKGGDEDTPAVENRLIGPDGELGRWTWERIPGSHHGSGCTLASALAAALALGAELPEATLLAQAYTWQAIRDGFVPGRGQRVPRRGGPGWRPQAEP
jgi:hydroxymethylpyrimidine/phosphomethylpyrimidine kinase